MENRRQDYRHTFAPRQQLRMELQASAQRGTAAGAIVDLSVGGAQLRLEDGSPPLAVDERCRACLLLPSTNDRLVLNALVVHVQTNASGRYCSLRFLPSADPRIDEKREQSIWRFLMDEQRRSLKQRDEES